MQLTQTGADTVSIKTKTEPITLGAAVVLGQYTVPGPGEYDVASIQCEGKSVSSGTVVYFIRTEDLNITFLPKVDFEASKLDDASNTDILVLDVRSDDTADSVKAVVKSIEPFYLILLGAGATPSFISELGLPLLDSPTLKISRTGLPLEGTSVLPRS